MSRKQERGCWRGPGEGSLKKEPFPPCGLCGECLPPSCLRSWVTAKENREAPRLTDSQSLNLSLGKKVLSLTLNWKISPDLLSLTLNWTIYPDLKNSSPLCQATMNSGVNLDWGGDALAEKSSTPNVVNALAPLPPQKTSKGSSWRTNRPQILWERGSMLMDMHHTPHPASTWKPGQRRGREGREPASQQQTDEQSPVEERKTACNNDSGKEHRKSKIIIEKNNMYVRKKAYTFLCENNWCF